jgi:hypothetical protein
VKGRGERRRGLSEAAAKAEAVDVGVQGRDERERVEKGGGVFSHHHAVVLEFEEKAKRCRPVHEWWKTEK